MFNSVYLIYNLLYTNINISFINLDNLNNLNTRINLTIRITRKPDKLVPSNIKLNKNGIIANKSIIFNGDNINFINDYSNAVELNNLKIYSKPKNINK